MRLSDAFCLYALLGANIRSWAPEKMRLFIMSFFMMIQNTMFFVLWILFFRSISHINGWNLVDVTRMFGLVASAIGLSLFFFNGIRSLPYKIRDGSLDALLTKPKHPLPLLLFSSSSPASLGDALYGPVMWSFLGEVTPAMIPLLLALLVLSMVLFTASMIMVFSLAFWLKGNPRLSDQSFEMLIIFSTGVLHGQPFGLKIIAFTLVPAGFISYVPTLLISDFTWGLFLGLAAAATAYAGIAVWVFNKGLARYKRA